MDEGEHSAAVPAFSLTEEDAHPSEQAIAEHKPGSAPEAVASGIVSDLQPDHDPMLSQPQHFPDDGGQQEQHMQQHELPVQQQPQQRVLQESFAAIRLGSARLASMVRNATAPLRSSGSAADQAPVSTSEGQSAASDDSNTLARVRATAGTLSARAKDSAGIFLDVSMRTAGATAEGLRRLALGEPLQALCRAETMRTPVPQLVLACCTALTSGEGLATQQIFKHTAPQELVDRLSAQCSQSALVPPGTSPHAVATLLKQFLLGLPEPLLTFRLLPDWVAAADKPETSKHLLKRLPVANANTLRLLLQTFHFINDSSAVNEMDALALAEAIAPCIGWTQAPPQAQQPGSAAQGPGLFKALSMSLGSRGASASGAPMHLPIEGPMPTIAEGGGPAGVEGEVAAADSRIIPLEAMELEGVALVIEYLTLNFAAVFG